MILPLKNSPIAGFFNSLFLILPTDFFLKIFVLTPGNNSFPSVPITDMVNMIYKQNNMKKGAL